MSAPAAVAPPRAAAHPVPTRRHLGSALAVLVWIPAVLLLDRGATLDGQRLLGAATWCLLVALLRREDPATRMQVGVVVAYATAVELTFSGALGVYVYRLDRLGLVAHWWDRVPAFVPPGHGLVYLAAVVLGRYAPRRTVPLAALAVSAYAAWGLLLSPRLDVLGALWAGCLVWFLRRGRAPQVYAAALLVVTMLEILGTSLGTWAWAPHDTITGWIAIGNPPSGAAGGYCFFDAAALAVAPMLMRLRAAARGAAE